MLADVSTPKRTILGTPLEANFNPLKLLFKTIIERRKMRREGWTYIRENMNTDNPVAYYVNKNGYRVFYVICTREGYITTNVIDGIKPYFISYSDARKLNTAAEEAQEDAGNVLFSALIHTCEKFEEDYNEQKRTLLEQL